jgi:hypothetical protein
MNPAKAPELCARCALDLAAHAVRTPQGAFCTWHCARQSELAAVDGSAVAVSAARARVVAKVKGRGARA